MKDIEKKASLNSIFATVFIDLLGFGILIPILPTFGSKVLNLSEFQIGIAIATYSFAQFIINPVLGSISDKIGRKKVIVSTLFLSFVSYVIFSFTTTYWQLLLCRAIGGIGGGNIGAAQAYVADITTHEERTKGMGIIGAAFGLGFIFGPLMAAFLSHYGYFTIGIVAALLSLLAFLYSLIFLKESLNIAKKDEHKRNFTLKYPIQDIFKLESKTLSLILVFFIITFSVANIYGTFALLGSNVFNFHESINGFLYGIMGLTSVISQTFLIKIFTAKFSEIRVLSIGCILMSIGLALMPFGHIFALMAIITIIFSIGSGILQPLLLSMLSKTISGDKMGSVLGVNQSMSALARILGPLWGGFSFNYIGYRVPFFTGAFFMILIFLFLVKTKSIN